ncbi:MAG: pilus assembly PilX N-terminal domain-containing protein [Gemmatimonadaceae bacterium]
MTKTGSWRESARFSPERKGFALPTVILGITIMSIIAVVALSTAADERSASRAGRESTLALYAGEAGLRQTYGNWPAAAAALKPGDSLDLGWQPLPNKADYRAVIHRVDGGGLQEYSVVVQGRRTDPRAGIITIVGAAGGVPIFGQGVRTDGDLYLANGGLFDSYDSGNGPYGPATVDTTDDLFANGAINITGTTVKGSASATGAISLGAGANVTGGTTPNAPAQPAMDINTCPVAGYTPTAKVPGGPGVSYSSTTGVLSVTSGTLTLTDTSYFFRVIVLTGNAKLAFPGNPAVSVVLRDSINAASATIINQSANAANLAFSSCGTSPTPAYWALSSNGTASYYTVYAPNHIVYETGGGDFYGAVVAQIYYASGGGRYHYDAALARLPSNKIAVQRGAWAQLPGA